MKIAVSTICSDRQALEQSNHDLSFICFLAMLRRAAPQRSSTCNIPNCARLTMRLTRRSYSDAAVGSNISRGIADKIGKNIYLRPGHPLNLVKRGIENYFFSKYTAPVCCFARKKKKKKNYHRFLPTLTGWDTII